MKSGLEEKTKGECKLPIAQDLAAVFWCLGAIQVYCVAGCKHLTIVNCAIKDQLCFQAPTGSDRGLQLLSQVPVLE